MCHIFFPRDLIENLVSYLFTFLSLLFFQFHYSYSQLPKLPECYYMQPPALKTGHLQQFQPETLFYIFYALPKDVLQAYAAQELYTREWRYHSDLKLWFKRAGPADGMPTPPSTVQQYLYFDINSWEKRLFSSNMNQNVHGGFLTDEDVRVRFAST